jgi:hypothetical protein
MIAALDYETFYSKDYSIRDLGNYAYTHHPEFDPYMLTAATDGGDTYCGNPLDFDYADVHLETWVMANAGFDLSVTDRIYELHPNDIPPAQPIEIFDVLDLARYLGYPGNLAGASEAMLGIKLDKGTRDKAKGKHWKDFTPDFQREMRGYALRDAQVTLKIWLKYGPLWPEHERELSRSTREMCKRGLPVDLPGIEKDIRSLETLLWKTRSDIPWAEDPDAPALSKKSMAIECRKEKIEPPASMAKDSELFDEWLRKYGDKFTWARAMGSYRSINGQLKRLRAMKVRCQEREGGQIWMSYGLKYGGAHTMRDSGDAGMNVQNFSKTVMFENEMRELMGEPVRSSPNDEVYGINIRGKIMAPDGFMLGVVDLKAIEPCCLNTLAEDWELVALLEEGMDPYEAWARTHDGYTDPRPLKEVDSKLRDICKVKVLMCGYGAGPDKLIATSKTMAGVTLSPDEAASTIYNFREAKFIPNLWNRLENGMRNSAPGDFQMELPSGRMMRYKNVRAFGNVSAEIIRGAALMRLKWWGGSLTENLVQASARDIFMDRVLSCNAEGLPPVLRVHDEAVCVLPEDTAEAQLKVMIDIFSTKPDWWQEVPVSADGHLCKRYTKK